MSAELSGGDRAARSSIFWTGYVYKGLKPVNWCINDRTALAEAEVEYEDHTEPVDLGAFRADVGRRPRSIRRWRAARFTG